jgi:exodeoxyribonuclease VII large subunit
MGSSNSEQSPLSVASVSQSLASWIRKLGTVWVEGQLSEVRIRPGGQLVYMRLRDTESDVSISLVAPARMIASMTPPVSEGAQVVVNAGVEYWSKRGDLHLRARQIRAVGLGELLARLEQLRRLLDSEGLFAPERKRPIPFLPRRVGLICGRNSEAERDVTVNARRRWPGVQFEIREVAVQGSTAVAAVTEALLELDSHPEVDVIIITRGGGSVEDLLPFSNEALVRAAATATTPIISAIGHERDRPILDDVADLRASTPTDAARRVVPDLAEERSRIADARATMRHRITFRLSQERTQLDYLRRSGALRSVLDRLRREQQQTERDLADVRRALQAQLTTATADLAALRTGLHALSPAATLDRGYAIVTDFRGRIAFAPDAIEVGAPFTVRLRDGGFAAARLPDPVLEEKSS